MKLIEAAQLIDEGKKYLIKYADEELNYDSETGTFNCPCCTGEGLLFFSDGLQWACDCCGCNGDIYDLASAIEGISWPDAVEWIAYKYGFPTK